MRTFMTMVTLLAAFSTPAFADGFVCDAQNEDLSIKIFNHVTPELGTRNAAVMVLSDPSVQDGRKTIAVFRDVYNTLTNDSAKYLAKVDLRFNESGRKGEYLAGTRLGHVATIEVFVDFVYGQNLEKGDDLVADAELTLRDGEKIQLDLDCVRYLKN